jgi:SAM-dependent methyltransferase
MSLSKEWALLSREMYGSEFVDELTEFLQKQNVRTILECGCGDGYVLQGLAKKEFWGVGVDASPEMVALALENHQHPNISYKQMSWLNIGDLGGQFDAVICRGNSLSAVASWGSEHLNLDEARKKIEESIDIFFQKLKFGGLLYLDTCSQEELDKKGGDVEIKTPNIQLMGKIEYDLQRMERRVFGSGTVFGEYFSGGSTSYLLTPKELESIVTTYSPSVVWHPKLVNERNYDIICAKK